MQSDHKKRSSYNSDESGEYPAKGIVWALILGTTFWLIIAVIAIILLS